MILYIINNDPLGVYDTFKEISDAKFLIWASASSMTH